MLIIANTNSTNNKSGASRRSSNDIPVAKRTGQSTSAKRTSSSQTARKATTQTTTRTTSQTQRGPSTQTTRKRKKKSSDSGAKAFLFIMLIAIAVFVAVVCIKGTDSDNISGTDTSAQSTQAVAENNNQGNENDLPVQGSADNTLTDDTGNGADNEEDKPSFYNPATVTDCNFATVVVNRNYRIPESYEDTLELTYVCGSNQQLQKDVAVHYEAMYNAALEDGIYLTPCSGYRSYETQVGLYNNKVNQKLNEGYSEDEAPIQAATVVMVPGSSEHNLGYAMDIVCVEEWFETTDEFQWLMENAEDYGFILRYPKDKQDVTMVIYEPWHWRYVGVDAAKAINESGLTLEEYYGKSAQ